MRFTKMHGCGNDYIVLDGMEAESLRLSTTAAEGVTSEKLISLLCDRHYGIGADGVLLIQRGKAADFEMLMFNPDGSRGEMCGNGIRCVGKYLWDRELTRKKNFTVESMGAVKELSVIGADMDGATILRVDMGRPVTCGSILLCDLLKNHVEGSKDDQEVVCVSMGNPHAVLVKTASHTECPLMSDLGNEWEVSRLGPCIEKAKYFPRGTNVEFVRVADKRHIVMRVWERGAGETLSCGTGACAAAAVCMQKGLTDDEITVKLLGGEVIVSRERDTGRLYLTGPAVTVFTGEINW